VYVVLVVVGGVPIDAEHPANGNINIVRTNNFFITIPHSSDISKNSITIFSMGWFSLLIVRLRVTTIPLRENPGLY
jgi:hypothetical protein